MPHETPQPFTVIPTERQIASIRFSPDGKFLFAAGRDGNIHHWDFSQPQTAVEEAADPKPKDNKPPLPVIPALLPLSGHDGWVTQIAFHPTQPWLISADSWGRLIGWRLDAETPQPAWNVPAAHDGWIRQIAVSSDGERVATCGLDKAIRLWSTVDGKQLKEFTGLGEDIYSLAFHPDGKSLVSGDLKGIVQQWDLAEGKVVRQFDASILYLLSQIQDVGGVRVLAFDTEGKTLAVAGAKPAGGGFVEALPHVKFFKWSDGTEIQTIQIGEKTEGFVHELACHPAGYWIGVCSGQPGRGRYFFHRTGEPAPFFTVDQQMPNCHSVALHPNGTRLAVASNAGTFGQQRSKAREGIYPGNISPIHVFDLAPATA
jgi:WD40 repeat protein